MKDDELNKLRNFVMECRAKKDSLTDQAVTYARLEELASGLLDKVNISNNIRRIPYMSSSIDELWKIVHNCIMRDVM